MERQTPLRMACAESRMSEDAMARVRDVVDITVAIASLHMIAGGYTVPAAYKEAALKAMAVLENVCADRDEWKTQHENLLKVRQDDISAVLARVDDQAAALREFIAWGENYAAAMSLMPDSLAERIEQARAALDPHD